MCQITQKGMKKFILFVFFFCLTTATYSFGYVNRIAFNKVLNERDHDLYILSSDRVLGLSPLYHIFHKTDELAVFHYVPDQTIYQDPYITSTTTNNHWIQLVMSDSEKVTINIEVQGMPLQKNSVDIINMEADYAYRDGNLFLTIHKTNQKGMVIFNGNEKDPLFIFVDKPIIKSDENNSQSFEGYHRGNFILPQSIQKVNIPLGSYFVGTIYSDHDFEVSGHGIISQEGTKHSKYVTGANNPIKCNIIAGGNAKMKINNITSIEPAMYHFWAWPGKDCEYESVKAFSFQYETDAFIGTRITNCFTKVNDDNVKLYLSDIIVRNLTVYMQGNGSVFQFGWGDYGSRSNILVENITLLRDLNLKDIRYVRSFINWKVPIKKNVISDVIF